MANEINLNCQNMEVAIIGSNSFLAQYITRKLLDNKIKPSLWGMSEIPEFNGLTFSRFCFPETMIGLKELLDYEVIIYCAGAGIQSNTSATSELIYELNTCIPINIGNFLAAKNYEGKYFTFGSYFEIGQEINIKYYNEEDLTRSNNPVFNNYSISKRLLSRYWQSSFSGLCFYHLILPNLYGKGESNERLIPYLINSIHNEIEIRLTSGTQVRQYIHAIDVANIIYSIILNQYPGGIYNICNKAPVQIKELVFEVLSATGNTRKFKDTLFGNHDRTDSKMPYLLIDNAKANSVFEVKPKIDLQEGIKLYLI